jgi:hypothetical protein
VTPPDHHQLARLRHRDAAAKYWLRAPPPRRTQTEGAWMEHPLDDAPRQEQQQQAPVVRASTFAAPDTPAPRAFLMKRTDLGASPGLPRAALPGRPSCGCVIC